MKSLIITCIFLVTHTLSANYYAQSRMFKQFVSSPVGSDSASKLLFIEKRDLAFRFIKARRLFFQKQAYLESFWEAQLCKRYIESVGDTSFPVYSLSLVLLGDIYFMYDDLDKSKKYFLEWHDLKEYYAEKPQSVYNSLALIYSDEGILDSSYFFYEQGYNLSKQLKDTVWVDIIVANWSKDLIKRNEYDRAAKLLNKPMHNFKQSVSFYELVANNHLQMASIAKAKKDISGFRNNLDSAQHYFLKQGNAPNAKWNYLKSDYFQLINRMDSSMYYFKNATALDVNRHEKLNPLELAKIEQFLLEQEQRNEKSIFENRINTLNSKNQSYKIISLLVAVVLGLCIVYLVIQNRRKSKLFRLREQQVAEELASKEENIKDLVSNIQSINKQLQSIDTLNKKQMLSNREAELVNDELLRMRLLTDQNWDIFKVQFDRVYPNFITQLLHLHGDLSPADLRVACLVRLNVSNQQMADLLCISKDSLRKSHQRLRQKLNITDQATLVEYIFNVSAN